MKAPKIGNIGWIIQENFIYYHTPCNRARVSEGREEAVLIGEGEGCSVQADFGTHTGKVVLNRL